MQTLTAALAGGLGTFVALPAVSTELPVPCAAGACGASGPSTWVTSGHATGVLSGSTFQVNQTTSSAILNWGSFNISADGKVVFNQPNSSATALNRIFQADPSRIFGTLQSNGSVYLINQNGFLFGPSSRVNVGGLLASSLNISDDRYLNGILISVATKGAPSLTEFDPVIGPDGQPVVPQVIVQQGAQLSTKAAGQRILLAGQTVDNSGTISAPDGQVILAAGEKVYLAASTDPKLRGLLVEVDAGGTAWNRLTGNISAARGDVTLIGYAVNQDGRVSASTSVNANGSVRLLARDTVTVNTESVDAIPTANRGGHVELGPHSVTDVGADLSDSTTALDADPQLTPSVEISGQQVLFSGGSRVSAGGGALNVTASSDPGAPQPATQDPNVRIHVDPGAIIDLSGNSVSVPVTRNLVTVQLRGNELADDPLQRNGALRGKTVIVDARVGTPIANVSGAIATTERTVGERLGAGGTASFTSSGDIVVASGAEINVSGGAVNYTGGQIQTTQLITASGLVDIGHADPTLTYTGVLNPTVTSTSDRFGVISIVPTPGIAHYDPGYQQGLAAGSIQFVAPAMVLNGDLQGHAVNGPYQRSPSTAVAGGRLVIGDPLGANSQISIPAVELVNQAPSIVVSDDTTVLGPLTLDLPVDFLRTGGFSGLTVLTNRTIELPQSTPLSLAPGANISLTGARIELLSDITSPGGSIKLSSGNLLSLDDIGGQTPGVHLGPGVTLDVSGNWTNDALLAPSTLAVSPTYINGGSIDIEQGIQGGTLAVDSGVRLLANGGAWLDSTGKTSAGKGGSINLSAEAKGGIFSIGAGVDVNAFGVSGALGGSFSLDVPRILIAPTSDGSWVSSSTLSYDPMDKGVLTIDPSLFDSHGFSSVSLRASGPVTGANSVGPIGDPPAVLAIAAGTTLNLSAQALELNASSVQQPTARTVSGFTTATLLPEQQRNPFSLSLSTATSASAPFAGAPDQIGALDIPKGVNILADPNSSAAFETWGNLIFDGTLHSAGGTVSMTINRPTSSDPGFVPQLALHLGPDARIDVSGETVYTPSDTGLLSGIVLPGGSVSLTANRGSVVTDLGSVIDFSGTQAPIDLQNSTTGRYSRELVASAGGSLVVKAVEGVSLLGDLRGHSGTGQTGAAPAGSLTVELSRLDGFSVDPSLLPTFPATPRIVELIDGVPAPQEFPINGFAYLTTSQIKQSGVDALTLIADGSILIGDSTQLSLGRSLTLTAPAIALNEGVNARLAAPYLAVGNARGSQGLASASPGSGKLTLSGDLIDLIGPTAVQGASAVTLSSTGDVRLRGNERDPAHLANNTGSFNVAGDLTVAAERVYSTTGAQFSFTASGAASNTVSFQSTGSAPGGPPLSAGGSIAVSADDILQGGTVEAPFGSISLIANRSLVLSPGSVTSVSGSAAEIPYGRVDNGVTWYYGLIPINATPVAGIPSRQVTLQGKTVDLKSGATVNLTGGGDLYAYQWVPGTGGTTDALAAGATPGLYAILPTLKGAAPYDPFALAGTGITAEQSIYLSGSPGLPAGTYQLLPARYALLPGAFLVSAVPGYQDLALGTSARTPDGAPIVAGYMTFGNTGLGATRTSGFVVRPGSYGRQLAAYTDNFASTFFAAQATQSGVPANSLPADAGGLLIDANSALTAASTVLTSATTGGRRSDIELIAPELVIDPTVSGTSTDGKVHIGTDVLNQWDPHTLLLGASNSGMNQIAVVANDILVTPGANLQADQVVLAAQSSITVDSSARIASTSAFTSAAAPTLALPGTLTIQNAGAGGTALLAVSDIGTEVPVEVSSGTASVNIATGARIASRGSIVIDGPGSVSLSAGALSATGARVALGSSQVAFSDTAGSAGGLVIDQALIGTLNSAASATISSGGAIELTHAVALGNAGDLTHGLQSLTFNAAGIISTTSDASSFSAQQIQLNGSSSPGTTPSAGTGSLTMNAGTVTVGPGTFDISGVQHTSIVATGGLTGQGTSALPVSGDVDISAGVLTAASGADFQISADGGRLRVLSGASGGTAPALSPGGAVSLSAQNIEVSGRIAAPSGLISLSATDAINVSSGGWFDVSGIAVSAAGATEGSNGGAISLHAGTDLLVASGARVDVSGGPGAAAGAFNALAGGAATLQSSFSANSAGGTRGGAFSLEAGSLNGFAALNQSLESAGFSDQRSFHVASGDLVLTAGETITARQTDLITDSGVVDVAGTIAAAGSLQNSSVRLDGGQGVFIRSGASVSANGSGPAGHGGTIELGTTNGALTVEAGSTMQAAGPAGLGQLALRAPAQGNDIAINSLAGDVSKFGTITFEPVLSFMYAQSPGDADFAAIHDALATYVGAAAPAILGRLSGSAANVQLRPTADVRVSGDASIAGFDLSTWRFNGDPANLSVRASGSLTIASSLTDGFQIVKASGGPGSLDALAGGSSSISLAAGANLSGATFDSVTAGAAADLVFAPGVVVRTGTGDITLASARDIIFSDGDSVYTGGHIAAPSTIVKKNYFGYLDQGGSLTVTAGRDVVGAAVTQSPGVWQPRRSVNGIGSWAVDPGAFGWNLGTLGGGDLSVSAGRDVTNLSAAAADTGLSLAPGVLTQFAGGDVSVTAGRNVSSGYFYVGGASGDFRAFGALDSARLGPAGQPVGTLIIAGNSALQVEARSGVQLSGVMNSTTLSQVGAPISLSNGWFTYGDASSVRVTADGGSVSVNDPISQRGAFLAQDVAVQSTFAGIVFPASVDVSAFAGDISFADGMRLFPSDKGQLRLFATRDILGNANVVEMSDAFAQNVVTPFSPTNILQAGVSTAPPAASGRHLGDLSPALIAAGRDINNIDLQVPKAAQVSAGRDIFDTGFEGQNLLATDITRIDAGRDITYSTAPNSAALQFSIAGPGELEVVAGRNIDLVYSRGVTSTGNLVNPNLASATGADITMIAGLNPAQGIGQFVQQIIQPSAAFRQELVDYMASLGDTGLTYDQAAAQFAALDSAVQRRFVLNVFFAELVKSGREVNVKPSLGYARGYSAIDALFPGSRNTGATASPYLGNISMPFSRIYTLDGGAINVLAPGGSLDVGLSNPPPNLGISRGPSDLGIVTQRAGDVNVFTNGDVLVNSSRIFTLLGGNIAIWSTTGNIDAGRGSKTAISAPPPTITITPSGEITIDFGAAVAGSGIRTINSEPGVTPGNVDLIAPAGFVNAGDAGIGAAGNLNVAAQSVVGLDNIQVGGTSTGVPPAVSGIGLSLSGASGVGSSSNAAANAAAIGASAAAESAAPLGQAALGWLDVFVTGLGDEQCKPDDVECLKRQKTH